MILWERHDLEVRGPGFPSDCSTCAEIFMGLSLLVYKLRGINETVSEVLFRHKIPCLYDFAKLPHLRNARQSWLCFGRDDMPVMDPPPRVSAATSGSQNGVSCIKLPFSHKWSQQQRQCPCRPPAKEGCEEVRGEATVQGGATSRETDPGPLTSKPCPSHWTTLPPSQV